MVVLAVGHSDSQAVVFSNHSRHVGDDDSIPSPARLLLIETSIVYSDSGAVRSRPTQGEEPLFLDR
jgi:hypothetical protein